MRHGSPTQPCIARRSAALHDSGSGVHPHPPVTCVRVQRGPDNQGVRFAVKLVPIEWLRVLSIPHDHDVEVERDKDYRYAGDTPPERVAWVESQETEGIHQLELNDLSVGQDYEMWVRLWHPRDPEKWKDQDPVVRTGGGPPDSPRG